MPNATAQCHCCEDNVFCRMHLPPLASEASLHTSLSPLRNAPSAPTVPLPLAPPSPPPITPPPSAPPLMSPSAPSLDRHAAGQAHNAVRDGQHRRDHARPHPAATAAATAAAAGAAIIVTTGLGAPPCMDDASGRVPGSSHLGREGKQGGGRGRTGLARHQRRRWWGQRAQSPRPRRGVLGGAWGPGPGAVGLDQHQRGGGGARSRPRLPRRPAEARRQPPGRRIPAGLLATGWSRWRRPAARARRLGRAVVALLQGLQRHPVDLTCDATCRVWKRKHG